MTSNRGEEDAHFTVRCKCGEVYHTDDTRAGQTLRCRCGRRVLLARPNEEYVRIVGATTENQSRRRRSRTRRSEQDNRVIVPGGGDIRGWRQLWAPIADAIGFALYDTHSRRPVRRWTAQLSWIWCAGVLLSWVLLITTSESFLPATLLAYGPRFVLLLPLVALVPLALLSSLRTLLPLVFGTVITLGPIMGGRVSWRTLTTSMPPRAGAQTLRVMTYNVDGGVELARRLPELIEQTHPDIVALQECGDALWQSLQALPNWHQRRYKNVCTASRWPIPVEDSMPRLAFARISQLGAGGTAFVARYIVATPYGQLGLVNLHLETARKGFEGLFSGDGFLPDRDNPPSSAQGESRRFSEDRLATNADIRERESERAAGWAVHGDPRLPIVVVGDFNLPVESTIYRKYWSDFTDAFESTGTGFGWSKNEGKLLHIRIDHVLGNERAPTPIGSWLGPNFGSDHLPVIADLVWPTR
jgi:endonuclease/exonuclease/phosphatase (EEP) superfamily protein YafD